MNEAVSIVQKYIDNYLFPPKSDWPTEEFLIRSTSRWAADEILSRFLYETTRLPYYITGREEITPDMIIKGFIEEVDYYAHTANSISADFMFTVARDTAKDILTFYMKGSNK